MFMHMERPVPVAGEKSPKDVSLSAGREFKAKERVVESDWLCVMGDGGELDDNETEDVR